MGGILVVGLALVIQEPNPGSNGGGTGGGSQNPVGATIAVAPPPGNAFPVGTNITLHANINPAIGNPAPTYSWSSWCQTNPQLKNTWPINQSVLGDCGASVGTHVYQVAGQKSLINTQNRVVRVNYLGTTSVTFNGPNQAVFQAAGGGLGSPSVPSVPPSILLNVLKLTLKWGNKPLGPCASGFAQERVRVRYQIAQSLNGQVVGYKWSGWRKGNWVPVNQTNPPNGKLFFQSPHIIDKKITTATTITAMPNGHVISEMDQEFRVTLSKCGPTANTVQTFTTGTFKLQRVVRNGKIVIEKR